MPVLVSNLQEKVAVEPSLEDILTGVVRELLIDEGFGEDAEVSLVFVDDNHIRELNSRYRGVDSVTDVLSFAMREGEPIPGEEEEVLLGDVVISLQAAMRQAGEYDHSFVREAAYLTAHGVLHLMGYDHHEEDTRNVMRRKEEAVLLRLNLSR